MRRGAPPLLLGAALLLLTAPLLLLCSAEGVRDSDVLAILSGDLPIDPDNTAVVGASAGREGGGWGRREGDGCGPEMLCVCEREGGQRCIVKAAAVARKRQCSEVWNDGEMELEERRKKAGWSSADGRCR